MKTFHLATCGDDVRIWNASTLELLHHFYASDSPKATSLSWSLDGRSILAVPKSGDCIHLSKFEPSLKHQSIRVKQPVLSATFARTTVRFLGIGFTSGDVMIYDVYKNKPRGTYKAAHKDSVTCVDFNMGDSFLASGGADGSLVLNNVVIMSSFTEIAKIPGTSVRQVMFSPLQKYLLVSALNQGQVDLWDAASKKHSHCFSRLHEDCTGVAFSHINNSFLLSVGTEGNIGMYDIGAKRMLQKIAAPEGLHSVGFLHDGMHFMVGGVSGNAYVYDLRRSSEPIVARVYCHMGPVTSVSMQPLIADEDAGMSIEQQTVSFTLRPAETLPPTTLTSLLEEKGANTFSPLSSRTRESGASSRLSSARLSRLSIDLAREGWGMFSPLHTAISENRNDSSSSNGSLSGLASKSEQFSSSPFNEGSVDRLEVLEEAPLSPIDSDCASACGDAGNFGVLSDFAKQSDVSRPYVEEVPTTCNVVTESNMEDLAINDREDVVSQSSSKDSGHGDPAPSNSDEAEAALVERMTQKFRLLFGVADVDSVLEAGNLAQVMRFVVRQELHDIERRIRAEQQVLFSTLRDEIHAGFRSLQEEIQELKKF